MSWKRFLAVGCSHGNWADPVALKTVLQFKRKYEPHTVIHLGDYADMTALRSGANPHDEASDLDADMASTTNFLEELEPSIIFDGNHDDRAKKLMSSPNKILKYCATQINQKVDALAKKLHARRIPYDLETGWIVLGDCSFGHGYMFSENALREHCEYRNTRQTCIAHLHTPGIANGRRSDHPVAYCVGYLGELEKFSYAKTNKARSRWNQGFAWGEYNDNCTVVRIEQKTPNGWRLPL